MPTDWLEVTKDWEGLIGVVLGAGLATVGIAVGRLFTRNRIKAAIEDELRANRHQIAQKRDILRQMLDALSKGGILPALSAPISTAVYDAHFPDIVTSLSAVQRDNLHIIYGRLKSYDQFMNEYEQKIKDDLNNNKIQDVNNTYTMHIQNINQGYAMTAALIDKYLEGKPADVFERLKNEETKDKALSTRLLP